MPNAEQIANTEQIAKAEFSHLLGIGAIIISRLVGQDPGMLSLPNSEQILKLSISPRALGPTALLI